MKKRTFLITLLLFFTAELFALLLFAFRDTDYTQDAVAVNEVIQSVQEDFNRMESHKNQTELHYVVLDQKENILFKTDSGLSETIHEAVIHRDTILDIHTDGQVTGKVIIYNDISRIFRSRKQTTTIVLSIAMLLQCSICMIYLAYIDHTVISPFHSLKGFAERIAGGDLDVPLCMDKHNLFGPFTESFDIMRAELKKARIAEARANNDKKELVAKLSHDIKTPVASIKAASEVGAALACDVKNKDNYIQIIHKADQINALITNLFTATLEELQQLTVSPEDISSRDLGAMLQNSDYLHRADIPCIPDCLLHADRLRLQQVFDNIFVNSYKYADSPISLTIILGDRYLSITAEDHGTALPREELIHIKEKFWRGSNTQNIEGAGLGLFISDYFMKNMLGELSICNGKNGLAVTVKILLSGLI